MPHHYVFGFQIRMFLYHWQYPLGYITIMCTMFAFTATRFLNLFRRERTLDRIALTAAVILVTVLLGSPLGGILWHYHDIKEGYWPGSYGWKKLFIKGPVEGLIAGWLIILTSIPYAYIGAVACYFILSYATKIFPAVTQDANGD